MSQPGFGQQQYSRLIAEYLPHPADLVSLVVTWLAAVVLMLAGAMVAGRRAAADIHQYLQRSEIAARNEGAT